MNELWFILFSVVLFFDFLREGTFILIYYTMWTFILETIFFALLVAKRENIAIQILPFIYAPAIVVCIGFWIIVAPAAATQPTTNIVLTIVVHGFNMIALLLQPYNVYITDLWKPVAYTIIYNIFLALYVGSGGRSISGKLPYWYAQYDNSIGWIFAGLAVTAAMTVHIFVSVKKKKKVGQTFTV
jgi:hypothetical protein|tara:strand:- start:173 stop:727 length:555 start_codon:yes stop_codon:yes gene_type:complete